MTEKVEVMALQMVQVQVGGGLLTSGSNSEGDTAKGGTSFINGGQGGAGGGNAYNGKTPGKGGFGGRSWWIQ